MRRLWRVLLPIVGLPLFTLVSWREFGVNREIHRHLPNKYFQWSAIRLNTDPTNQASQHSAYKDDQGNGVSWDLQDTWVEPGLLDGFLLVTAFPAFVLARLIAGVLGTLGINELTSFMFFAPILLLCWYYLVGRLTDGWIHRKSKHTFSTSD
jgi:hypothetical protein